MFRVQIERLVRTIDTVRSTIEFAKEKGKRMNACLFPVISYLFLLQEFPRL